MIEQLKTIIESLNIEAKKGYKLYLRNYPKSKETVPSNSSILLILTTI